MGLYESHVEKKNDIRVIERANRFAKLDKAAYAKSLESLEDISALGQYVNIDEINAKDNPVHTPRNLPSLEDKVRKNLEDLEFDADESNRAFEQ
ncbi:MAG: hypothetical protein M9962_01095 [Oligoflexia bacterium]|nr:hypothetical protein [Oligoflexia bacterium]